MLLMVHDVMNVFDYAIKPEPNVLNEIADSKELINNLIWKRILNLNFRREFIALWRSFEIFR